MAASEPNTPGTDGAPPEHPARAAARAGASLAARAGAHLRAEAAAAARRALRSAAAGAAWLWTRRPPAPRAAALAFVIGAAVVSAASILAQAGLAGRLPSALDWAAARTLVERDARPGDAVIVSPAWAERAREVMPGGVPVLAVARTSGEDLIGVRRAWLVSLPYAPRFTWDAELDLLERAARADPGARLGALEVTRYDLAFPSLPLAFLPDRLGDAEPSLGDEVCATDARGGVVCPLAGARVAREVREVDGVARPCLVFSFERAPASPLVLTFTAQRLGRTVQGHAGPAGGADGAVAVRVAVQVDGEEVGVTEVQGRSFAPFRIDTTRFASQVRSLTFVVTPSGATQLCLDAVTVP